MTPEIDPDDPAVTYMQLAGHFPRGKAIAWIDDLIRQFGPVRVRKALVAAHLDGGTDGMLGRASDLLRMEERQAAQRERQRLQQRQDEARKPIAAASRLILDHNWGKHQTPADGCRYCAERVASA